MTIYGPTIWRTQDPTPENLSGLVTRVDRPRPHEIVNIRRVQGKKAVTFELTVKRDPCPVRLLPGMTTCPICGGSHDSNPHHRYRPDDHGY